MSESKYKLAQLEGLTRAGYDALIEDIASRLYSGSNNKGKLNIYVCELAEFQPNRPPKLYPEPDGCGSMVVTRDVDNGVTPAFIMCPTCGGQKTMISSFYRVQNHAAREGSQWYRPGFEEWQKLGLASKQHVINGGLILRPYKAD